MLPDDLRNVKRMLSLWLVVVLQRREPLRADGRKLHEKQRRELIALKRLTLLFTASDEAIHAPWRARPSSRA